MSSISRWDSCRTCEWSTLADDFRTFLVQGNLEIDGLDTFALVLPRKSPPGSAWAGSDERWSTTNGNGRQPRLEWTGGGILTGEWQESAGIKGKPLGLRLL